MDNTHNIRRISIKERHSKVTLDNLGKVPKPPYLVKDLIQNLPGLLAASDFRDLIDEMNRAGKTNACVIAGIGGHVIKTGLAPYLITLMEKGFIKAIAMNGAALIHDFELAYHGETSEDVEQELGSGNFGFSQETGQLLNQFILEGHQRNEGLGETMTRAFQETALPHLSHSVIGMAGKLTIPVTIHVAVGTDIIHMHPECNGAAIGSTTFRDFQRFCQIFSTLHPRGGYLNIGSAVLLPEVFLKALSLARNKHKDFSDFFTANFDFIKHYRPMQSIINRPRILGARSYSLTGHHEIMIPLFTVSLLAQ